jgi:hypothetical protein
MDDVKWLEIAVNTAPNTDLYYTYEIDGRLINYKVAGVSQDESVPSITDVFLAAFVFENEARELFGVDMHDIAIDFAGAMYAPAVSEPMTIITPEQKAAREKARKAAEAKKKEEYNARINEVNMAFEKAYELRDKFIADYGEYKKYDNFDDVIRFLFGV